MHPFFTLSAPPSTLPQEALLQTPMFCRKSNFSHQHRVILPTPNIVTVEYEEDGDVKMTEDTIIVTPVQEPNSVPVHVLRFLDSSKNFGLAYQLSNGAMGVFFNDHTSLVTNSTV
jgi:hypothetical protein